MGLRSIDRPTECERFARAFMVEGDPIQAYFRVHPRAQFATACREGRRLLARPEVQACLAAVKSGKSLGDLRSLLQATKRPRACRYCHGERHGYQRTAKEQQSDLQAHEELERRLLDLYARAGKTRPARSFDPRGGVGFDPSRDPHPECPNCFGRGESGCAAMTELTGEVRAPSRRSSAR